MQTPESASYLPGSAGRRASPTARTRPSRPLPSGPLGTATYDPDISERAARAASQLMDAFPDLEPRLDLVVSLLSRVLDEQDRASRTDEVLRRFSPSVRHYVERKMGTT